MIWNFPIAKILDPLPLAVLLDIKITLKILQIAIQDFLQRFFSPITPVVTLSYLPKIPTGVLSSSSYVYFIVFEKNK